MTVSVNTCLRALYAVLLNLLIVTVAVAQPAFSGATPFSNAINVALDANINIGFNQLMDESTLNETSIFIHGSLRGTYSGTFTYSGASSTTAIFNPDENFLPGEQITVTITTAAQNTIGDPLARFYTYSFTAAAQGGGQFLPEVNFAAVPSGQANDVVAADFNGDGHVDLAVLSQGSNSISVHFNNGDGTFASPVVLTTANIPMTLRAADVNGNGHPDLLVANASAQSLSVFVNNGNNTFEDRADFGTSATLAAADMVVMDLNGDGHQDVVQLQLGAPGPTNNLFFFTNDGTGNFGTGFQYTIADLAGSGSLAVSYHNGANSNQTRRAHLLVTDFNANQLRVYENTGTGNSFVFEQTRFAGTGPVAATALNLTGTSGQLDAVVANRDSDNLTVYLASGGTAFASQSNYGVGGEPYHVLGGDINGNGSIDLVAVKGTGSRISILPNNSATFFTNIGYNLSANPNRVALADLNGNGQLDIITANTNGTVSILYNYDGPEIVTTSPQAVGAYDDLQIEFSVDFIDVTTLTASNVLVRDASNAIIASSFSFAGNTLTITPDAPLQQGTTVTVQLTAGVTTTSGHALANPGTISFNVAASVLGITSTSPAAYDFRHPVSSGLSVTFDEAIVLSTLDAGITVSGSIRGTYSGSWSGSSTATFTPSAGFLPGEQITVTVGTSVASLSGASLDDAYLYTFAADSNPLGSFLAASEFATAPFIENNIVVTDMTNNGNPDVVIWGYDWEVEDSYFIRVISTDGLGNAVTTTTTIFEPYRPKAYLVGDFNNDGNKDVIILDSHVSFGDDDDDDEEGPRKALPGSSQIASGENLTSLFLFTGNGDGSFNAPTSIALPSDYEIRTFALGDLNGNGNLDLVFPREDGNDVIVALGNGSGGFAVQSPISTPGGPVVAKLTDINLDGIQDLVIGTANTKSVVVRYGNGDGTFGSAETFSTGIEAYDILIADFNNDGNPDLAVLNQDSQTQILLNNGLGGFTSAQTFSTGWLGAVIDFNGDNFPDLVFNNSGASVYTNNGDGTFNTTPNVYTAATPAGLAIADMTGNGSVDIVGHIYSSIFVMGSAEPVFVSSTFPVLNALDVTATATPSATFNVDMDAATITSSTVIVNSSVQGRIAGTLDYNAGTRTVTFTPTGSFLPGEVVSLTLTRGIESAAGVPIERSYTVRFTVEAEGNGSFVYNNALNTGSVTNSFLYAADVDGDGDEDLIGLSNGAVKVYKNDAGTFSEFSSIVVTGTPQFGLLGDFNNDGHVDVAYRRPFSSSNLYFLQNDGTGEFTSAGTNNMGTLSQNDAIVADFDNDGNLDVAFIINNQQINFLWGNGDFTFATGFMNTSGHLLQRMVSGDINNDGLTDIVGYDNNGRIVVIQNNGNRSFAKRTDFSSPIAANDIALADLSGNGYLDIVLTSRNDKAFAVFFNNGNGTFALPVTYGTSPYELNRVVPFDFTGNGSLDLALHATDDDEGVDFLLMAYNDGNGGMGNQLSFTIPSQDPDYFYGFSRNFTLLDANGDGAIDVAGRITNGSDQFIAFAYNEELPGAGSSPTVAATNASSSNVSFDSATLSWTNGDGARRLVLVKEGAPVDATLTDDGGYGANPRFGSGTEVGTGNFVVFGGNSSSVSVSGLAAETEYHFAVFEINGIPGQEKVLTATPATGSFTTTEAPVVWRIADGAFTFTKDDYADWTLEANQDRIAYNIWITRANRSGLFNAFRETSYNDNNGRIEWAFGTADDIGSISFMTFQDAVGEWGYLEDVNDDGPVNLILHLIDESIYVEVRLEQWTSGQNGGGFSYTRAAGTVPPPPPPVFDAEAGFALQFDGIDDYVYFDLEDPVTEDYDPMPDPVTFEMWVKPGTFTDDKMVIGNSWGTQYEFGIDSTRVFYAAFREGAVGPWKRATGTTVLNDNQWYHLAISAVSAGSVRLYVNGALEGSVNIAELNTSIDRFHFGGKRFGTNGEFHRFNGLLDEVRIWKVERTASQIREKLFTTASGGDFTTMFATWQMNEGTGTTVVDLVNGNNLDLAQDGASVQPAWVASDIPLGGVAQVSSGVQSGTTSVGNAALTLTTPFENPVDVFFNEITSAPNQFPTGATASLGGRYFVIDLVGDPGTFSLDLTLTFGPDAVTAQQEANPSLIKLYRRSSSSTGEWTELSGATSAIASTGAVTWTGITSFSQFIAIATEPEPGSVGIDDTSIIVYDQAAYTFASDFFAFTGSFENATLTVTADVTTIGTLFVDVNENGTFDEGTDHLLVAETGVSYTASGDQALIYLPSGFGTDTFTLSFTDGTDTDEVTLTFVSVLGSPELPGVANEGGWYLLTNPLETTLGVLTSNVWTQGAVNSNAPGGDATLYTFDVATSSFEAITGDLNETILPQGTGLAAFLFAFDDFNAGIPEGGGWPKTLSNTGNPFGSTPTVAIRNVDHDGVTGTSGSEGFILFGNPFGWSISADSVIARLKSVDPLANSYVYRWNPVARTYQLLTTGAIAPYESVFIRAITSGLDETISFNYDDAINVMRPAKEAIEPMFAFTLTHPETGILSESWIRFDDKASAGIDPFDGYYLGTYASTFANLYTRVDDQSLVINNLPSNLMHEVTYPIYLHSSVSGEFELTWDATLLPEGWELVVTEVATGLEIDVTTGSRHLFSLANVAKKVNDTLQPGALVQQDGTQPVFILNIRPQAITSLEDGADIPRVVELSQNFPNPFNPTTTIRYGVPEQSMVRLEVFDILGRRVTVLVNNEMRQPGRYSASFDARNLASGVYMYRLIIGDQVMTKQMMLIK